MKRFLLITVGVAATIIPSISLALEVDFPEVSGLKPGQSFGPGHWVKYIFVFGLAVVGLAIIYALTRAGFLWMTAGDNSGKISEAKDWIKGSVIGLVILVGSYTFLNTINPQLVSIRNPRIQIDVQDTWLKNFGVGWNKLYNPGDVSNKESKPCSTENVCNVTGLTCITAAGEAVKRGEQGFCSTYRAIGQACNNNTQCYVGKCVKASWITMGTDKVCDDQKRANREVCSTGTQCLSGVCAEGWCADKPVATENPPTNTTPPAETGGGVAATEWPFGFKANDSFFVDKSKFSNPNDTGNGLRMRSAPAGSVMRNADGNEVKFPYDTRGQIVKFAEKKDISGTDFNWFQVVIGGQTGYVAGEFITKVE